MTICLDSISLHVMVTFIDFLNDGLIHIGFDLGIV